MIVLDTHVRLWWINRDRSHLKPAWTTRIESAEPVGVSAISCFEIAWLTHHGRIELPIAENAVQITLSLLTSRAEINGIALPGVDGLLAA